MTISACQYLHDTHLECHSLDEAVNILLDRGLDLCEYGLTNNFPAQGRWSWEYYGPSVFAHHFFGRAHGHEIASYLPCMDTVVPALVILDKPRPWSGEFKRSCQRLELGGYLERRARIASMVTI